MCVIICCDKKSGHVSKEMLKNAEQINRDGMGMAWINKDGLIEWRKGLNSKAIWKLIRKEKPSLDKGYIVHARIASVGAVIPELTHPFEVCENATSELSGTTQNPVLFHNGTWLEYQEIMMKSIVKSGKRMYKGHNSDSRSMAWLAHNHGIDFLQFLEQDNKIAILTTKGIRRFGNFPFVDKHACSNTWFKPAQYTEYSDLMNGQYDYEAYCKDRQKLNDYENGLQYCPECDNHKSLDKFNLDYDICDTCFYENNNPTVKDIELSKKITKHRNKSKKNHEILVNAHRQSKVNEAIKKYNDLKAGDSFNNDYTKKFNNRRGSIQVSIP